MHEFLLEIVEDSVRVKCAVAMIVLFAPNQTANVDRFNFRCDSQTITFSCNSSRNLKRHRTNMMYGWIHRPFGQHLIRHQTRQCLRRQHKHIIRNSSCSRCNHTKCHTRENIRIIRLCRYNLHRRRSFRIIIVAFNGHSWERRTRRKYALIVGPFIRIFGAAFCFMRRITHRENNRSRVIQQHCFTRRLVERLSLTRHTQQRGAFHRSNDRVQIFNLTATPFMRERRFSVSDTTTRSIRKHQTATVHQPYLFTRLLG
mmetsp:Transcript_36033/g.59149  ORF Transcript_36033/g.59149 Transcript_36033/m.59149 type:complete len:257 (+) Transcript_36033:354-1124(+)